MVFALLISIFGFSTPPDRVLPIVSVRGNVLATGTLLDKWTVLTASHAVGEERTIVFLRCGEQDVAGVVSRRGKVQDLALITLNQACQDVMPAELSTEDVAEGSDITFVGYPTGKLTRSTGKVKGFAMFAVKSRVAGSGLFWIGLLFDGDVRPGNSGGPVFAKNGKLVGIIHGYHEASEGKPGIGIPLSAIVEFLKGSPPEDP